MSFEVFLSSFRSGKPAGLPKQRVADAFGKWLTLTEPDFWTVEYDEANHSDIYLTIDRNDPNATTGFMVSRPCGHLRLWDALYAVMRMGNVILFYPGCRTILAASDETPTHLAQDFVRRAGGTTIVRSGQDILDDIRSS